MLAANDAAILKIDDAQQASRPPAPNLGGWTSASSTPI
jgi:hypothetical protein